MNRTAQSIGSYHTHVKESLESKMNSTHYSQKHSKDEKGLMDALTEMKI